MTVALTRIRAALALCVLAAGTVGTAQEGGLPTTPYTAQETQDMSRVWATIRGAARYEDINWGALALTGPPGSSEAQSLTSRHWSTLRSARNFSDINWLALPGYSGAGAVASPAAPALLPGGGAAGASASGSIDLGEIVPNVAAGDRVAIARVLYDPQLLDDDGYVGVYASRFECRAAADAARTEESAAAFAALWRQRLLDDARTKDIVGSTLLASWEVTVDSYVPSLSGFPVRRQEWISSAGPLAGDALREQADLLGGGMAKLDAEACRVTMQYRFNDRSPFPVHVRTFQERLLDLVPASGADVARIAAAAERQRYPTQMRIRAPVRIDFLAPQSDGSLVVYGKVETAQLVMVTPRGQSVEVVQLAAWNPRATKPTRPVHQPSGGSARLTRYRLQPALLDDDEFLWSEAMLLDCVRAADARRLNQLFGERVYLDRYRTQRRNEAAQAPTLVGTTVRVGVDFSIQEERAIRDPWSFYDATNGGLHVGQAAILQSAEPLTYRGMSLPTSSVDCGPNPTIGSPGARWTGSQPELSVRFEPTAGGTIDFLPLDAAVARRMVSEGRTFVPAPEIVEAGMRVEQESLDGSGTLVLRGPIVDLRIEYYRTSPHEAEVGAFSWDGSGDPPWFRRGGGSTGPGQ